MTTVRSPSPLPTPALPRYCERPLIKPTAAAAPNLTNACNIVDVHQRVHTVVHLYSDPIRKTLDEDERADVWFVVVPDLVYERCRPQSVVPRWLQVKLPTRLSSGMARKLRTEVSMFDELNQDVVPYNFQPHFRNQLKAVLLDSNTPTQVVRESTLAPYDFLNKFGYPRRRIGGCQRSPETA